MPTSKDKETVGQLIRKEIDAGCERLDITHGAFAEKIGMHRVSLYNLLARPAGISLQSLVRMMEVLGLSRERRGFLAYKWCEDRIQSNHFVALLFPALKEAARRAALSPEEVGLMVLATFQRLHRD